jgi:hypothetical protein
VTLVTYGAEGKVETVRYLTLITMLLNELQKQARENRRQAGQIEQLSGHSLRQAEQIERQAVEIWRLAAQVAELKSMFEQALATLRGTHGVAAAFNR